MSIRNILSKKAKEAKEIREASIFDLVNNYDNYQDYLTSMDVRKIQAVKETMIEYKVERAKKEMLSSSSAGGRIFNDLIGESEQEEVVVLSLNTKNEIIGIDHVFKGSLNSSIAHPREILRTVLKYPSARFVIGHNHPSGDTEPSQADIRFTERIVEAGELLGIECLDHFIVGGGAEYCSLREEGHM